MKNKMGINTRGTVSEILFALIMALGLLFAMCGCCPRIVPETSSEVIKTRIDTVFLTDTLYIASEISEEVTIDVSALCDSLLKRQSDSYTETKTPAQKQVHRNKPAVTGFKIRKDSSDFKLSVDLSSYVRIIDSMRMHITVQDSILTTKTFTRNECDKDFHKFTVYFFYFFCAGLFLWILLKWIKPF